MADNVTTSIATIAADELTDSVLGTVKVQYVKIMDGTIDGTAKAGVSTGGGLQVGGPIASGVTDAGNPIKIGGVKHNVAPLILDGQRGDGQVDTLSNILVSLATRLAGEDFTNDVMKVEPRFSYRAVTAVTATVVRPATGFLHSVTINNPSALVSATTATTIALYDNPSAASGALVATLTLPVSANLVSALPFTIPIDVVLFNGLTTLITLGTSGVWTPNLTFSVR